MVVAALTRRALISSAAALAHHSRSVGGDGLASPGSGLAVANTAPRRIRPPRHRLNGWMVSDIGFSTQGRPTWRWDSRPRISRCHVVVMFGIHGGELAARDLAEGFGRINRPDDLHLRLVPVVNPDGWHGGTRRNSRDVNLNRNFPWGWNDRRYAGSGPASQIETRNTMWMLGSERPDLTVWVHQPLGYVAALAGCSPCSVDILSDVSGVPVRQNVVQVGGGESWTGLELGRPSMLVEVGGSRDTPSGMEAHVEALEALLFGVRPSEA